MRDAVLAMLKMQDRMNRRVHPQWEEQGYAWHRAIWVECAELVDHHGYKWWKHQEADMAQVQLEVIDIWHFGMSSRLAEAGDPESLADTLTLELSSAIGDSSGDSGTPDLLEASDRLSGIAAAERRFCAVAFANLLTAAGLDFGELYRQYLGKNVLNFFRQDNGYKQGSYRKLWAGREDNEHLMEILQGIDTADGGAESALYSALTARYADTAGG